MGKHSQRRSAANLRTQEDRRRLLGAQQISRPDSEARSESVVPHIDRRLGAAVERAVSLGWSGSDLVHAFTRESPRQGRLVARLVTTSAAGVDTVAPGPHVEPWRLDEGLSVDDATRTALLLAMFLELVTPMPPRRRGAISRPNGEVLAKVRALLAKAESTTFPAEAEALTAKAQELMSRHAIDEAMLAASSDLAQADRSMSVGRVHLEDPYLMQKADLLHVVARANGARAVVHGKLGIATIVGAAPDLDMVELLFTSLLLQATVAMQEAGRQHAEDRTRGFRASFLAAFAVRIGERLGAAREAATDAGRQRYGSALVPVLAAKEDQVDATLHELFPRLRTRSGSQSFDARGWYAGRSAADRADVGGHDRIAS